MAQLNLLLKIAEKKKRLPILQQNIKNGNSLIDDPNVAGDKAFKWTSEFSEFIVNGRGFDIIIGNPPYIMVENLPDADRKYLMNNLKFAHKRFDIYLGFIEKCLSLLKENGVLGFIIPFPFLNQDYSSKLRQEMLNNYTILSILDLSETKVFKEAMVKTVILIIQNKKPKNNNLIKIRKIDSNKNITDNYTINQNQFLSVPEYMIRICMDHNNEKIIRKMETNSIELGRISVISWGARGVPVSNFHLDKKLNEKCKPLIKGKDIKRYELNYHNKFLLYDTKLLYRPAFVELFENPKLVIQKVTGRDGLNATFDGGYYYTDDSLNCLILKQNVAKLGENFFGKRKIKMLPNDIELSKRFELKYLLSLINSKAINFYFKIVLGYKLNVYPESLEKLPIKVLTKEQQIPFVELVDNMLTLNIKLKEYGGKETTETAKLKSNIEDTDQKINELVYKTYGITDQERKIIEYSS